MVLSCTSYMIVVSYAKTFVIDCSRESTADSLSIVKLKSVDILTLFCLTRIVEQ